MDEKIESIVKKLDQYSKDLSDIIEYKTSLSPEYLQNRFRIWRERVLDYIAKQINHREFVNASNAIPIHQFFRVDYFLGDLTDATIKSLAYLNALMDSLRKDSEEWLSKLDSKNSVDLTVVNPLEQITNLLNKFHSIVRKLRVRYDNRQTLDVKDEYDVQDLLHTLLLINFDDIRPEENTPSLAGKSSRMDFLLDDYGIVIETKYATQNHSNTKIKDELIIDIPDYKQHPNSKILICFIYDPDGYMHNPQGFIKDIEKQSSEDLDVKVFIKPD